MCVSQKLAKQVVGKGGWVVCFIWWSLTERSSCKLGSVLAFLAPVKHTYYCGGQVVHVVQVCLFFQILPSPLCMTPAKSLALSVHALSPTPLPRSPHLPRPPPTSPLVIARGPGLNITLIYRGGPAPYQRSRRQVLLFDDPILLGMDDGVKREGQGVNLVLRNLLMVNSLTAWYWPFKKCWTWWERSHQEADQLR